MAQIAAASAEVAEEAKQPEEEATEGSEDFSSIKTRVEIEIGDCRNISTTDFSGKVGHCPYLQ